MKINFSNWIIYSIAICVLNGLNVAQLAIARTTCCQTNRLGRRFFIHQRPMPAVLQLVQIEAKTISPIFPPFEIPSTEPQLIIPSPIVPEEPAVDIAEKAILCSKLICSASDLETPVCACNYKTGNVVSFSNKCDMIKHNCRFDTGFKPILYRICPWEFESRRAEINSDD